MRIAETPCESWGVYVLIPTKSAVRACAREEIEEQRIVVPSSRRRPLHCRKRIRGMNTEFVLGENAVSSI
jgi:hypothetical protein